MPPKSHQFFTSSLERTERRLRMHARIMNKSDHSLSPDEVKNSVTQVLKELYVRQIRTVVMVFILSNSKIKTSKIDEPKGEIDKKKADKNYGEITNGSNLKASEIMVELEGTSEEGVRKSLRKMMDDIHAHCTQVANNFGIEFEGEKPDIDRIMSAAS